MLLKERIFAYTQNYIGKRESEKKNCYGNDVICKRSWWLTSSMTKEHLSLLRVIYFAFISPVNVFIVPFSTWHNVRRTCENAIPIPNN